MTGEVERHRPECAYAGLPRSIRGELPWPADPNEEDMCICATLDHREAVATEPVRMEVTLALCPSCKKELVVVEGKPQGLLTFWMGPLGSMITPHDDNCELKGKALV